MLIFIYILHKINVKKKKKKGKDEKKERKKEMAHAAEEFLISASRRLYFPNEGERPFRFCRVQAHLDRYVQIR